MTYSFIVKDFLTKTLVILEVKGLTTVKCNPMKINKFCTERETQSSKDTANRMRENIHQL